MPGTLLGTGVSGTTYPHRRADRWLNFRFAFPPNQNIRDRDDTPGAGCPYHLWQAGDVVGGEDTGMAIMKIQSYDDDISFKGTKAYSYNIRGICLDAGGAPVAGATVELYRLPNWVDGNGPFLVATTTANALGEYGFAVSDTVTNYKAEAYIVGKGGVTVRNLVGST